MRVIQVINVMLSGLLKCDEGGEGGEGGEVGGVGGVGDGGVHKGVEAVCVMHRPIAA